MAQKIILKVINHITGVSRKGRLKSEQQGQELQ
jgi:hypothetical protein